MNDRSRRRGCFGCGCLGCLGQLVALLIFGGIVALALPAPFSPWAYFLGGTFHVVPAWWGKGTLHSRSGDYELYVTITPNGVSRVGSPEAGGDALLVSPAGERHVLKIFGVFPGRWYGTNTNGRRFILQFHHRVGSFNTEARPEFDLEGAWHDPDLVMSDKGSLSRAFTPDGRAWLGSPARAPAVRETLTVVLRRCGLLDAFYARWGWKK